MPGWRGRLARVPPVAWFVGVTVVMACLAWLLRLFSSPCAPAKWATWSATRSDGSPASRRRDGPKKNVTVVLPPPNTSPAKYFCTHPPNWDGSPNDAPTRAGFTATGVRAPVALPSWNDPAGSHCADAGDRFAPAAAPLAGLHHSEGAARAAGRSKLARDRAANLLYEMPLFAPGGAGGAGGAGDADDAGGRSSATPQPAVSPECEQKHAALLSQQGELAQLEAQLEALLAAEADEAIRREVAELRASLAQVDEEDVEAAEELGELRERATALRGRLAARQAALDEVDLSSLEAEARQAARGRRKAACAELETLLPEVQALCEEILAARKRLA